MTIRSTEPVTILGGGLTGLVLADALAQGGRSVTVVEKNDEPGGLCRSILLGGRRWDRYYHHIFQAHREAVALLETIGLGGDLKWITTRQGVVSGNRARSLDHPVDHIVLARADPREIWKDYRFASALKKLDTPDALDSRTALEWLADLQTEKKIERFWKPMLQKKFDTLHGQVSAWWLADRITARSSSKRMWTRGETLGHLEGGFSRLIEHLHERCVERGVRFSMGTAVEKLAGRADRIDALVTSAGQMPCPGPVISTLALAHLVPLLPDWMEPVRERIGSLRYVDCACVLLELDRSLSPYYWLSNFDAAPFAAVIEESKLFARDQHVVYLPRYLPHGPAPDAAWRDDLVDQARAWLEQVFPGFANARILDRAVVYDAHCQPVFETGYLARGMDVLRPADNLIVTDIFLNPTYNSRTMNATIQRAKGVLKMIT